MEIEIIKKLPIFIEHLVDFLRPHTNARLIDAACGAGRHSIHLNKLGFDVVGYDLSPSSIETAKAYEKEGLKFQVADLRTFEIAEKVDYVMNLFTSFGYFGSAAENLQVLERFHQALKSEGKLIIDFFNAEVVVKNLVQYERKMIDGIEFDISKSIENKRIIKRINFSAEGKGYEFYEKVSAFTLDDFNLMLEKSGFSITHTFGDYFLTEFDKSSSPRLVIIAEKIG